MNKFYKIALTALSTALISVSALAGPNDHRGHQHPSKPSHIQQHKPLPPHAKHPAYHATQQHHKPAPMHKWQAQHKLPDAYKHARYKVNNYQRYQLSKPSYNQAWYKVDGHYLLTNTHTGKIIKVVRS